MKPPRNRIRHEPPTLALTSMIDVVFVLLTFFMLTSTFEAQEREMAFRLPGAASPGVALELPDEQVVELTPTGQVRLNEQDLDGPGGEEYVKLQAVLSRFQQSCRSCGTEAAVTLAPDAETPHQAVVRALDAVKAAGIIQIRFSLGG